MVVEGLEWFTSDLENACKPARSGIPFENLDLVSRLGQAKGCGQPGKARPYDGNVDLFHVTVNRYARFLRRSRA